MQQNEFTVEDFVAEDSSFPIEVVDASGSPLKSAQIKITIDDGDEQTIDPEEDGKFKITPEPKTKLIISNVIGGESEGKSFTIEVEDRDGNRIDSVQLKAIIDDGDEQTIDAGDDGNIKLQPVPKSNLKITAIVN